VTPRAPAPARAKIGRPTLLTPKTIEAITNAIALGATYELACQYAGISRTTFFMWKQKGEAERERLANGGKPDSALGRKMRPFLDFLNAIEKAEGEAVVLWLAKIEQAASDGNWQAAAWKLERRYPKLYGRNYLTLGGDEEEPVAVRIDR
jgi:hypothetical protein